MRLPTGEIERVVSDQRHAALSRVGDRLHLTLEALESDDETPTELVRHEIDLIVGPNVVITIHEGPIKALARFSERVDAGETLIGALDAVDLMSSLTDAVFAGYFETVERIQREIDELDERALRGRRDDDVLQALVDVRRRVGLVRRTLAPHREVMAALARPEMRVEETIGIPWSGLGDRLEHAMEAVEGLRDSLIGTYDIHMGRAAQRANDVMKALTVLSAVLLPAVVLAGIMGMNFQVGFFENPADFWLVLLGIIVFAVGILAFARWRRWI